MTREPVAAAEEMIETLAMFVCCACRSPAVRLVITTLAFSSLVRLSRDDSLFSH